MDLEYIKHDYKALGMRLKGMAALLDFDYFLDHGNDQEGFEGKWWMLRASNFTQSVLIAVFLLQWKSLWGSRTARNTVSISLGEEEVFLITGRPNWREL